MQAPRRVSYVRTVTVATWEKQMGAAIVISGPAIGWRKRRIFCWWFARRDTLSQNTGAERAQHSVAEGARREPDLWSAADSLKRQRVPQLGLAVGLSRAAADFGLSLDQLLHFSNRVRGTRPHPRGDRIIAAFEPRVA